MPVLGPSSVDRALARWEAREPLGLDDVGQLVAEVKRLREALRLRYRTVEHLRLGSGGSPDDDGTGDAWYRAQQVALRDFASAAGINRADYAP